MSGTLTLAALGIVAIGCVCLVVTLAIVYGNHAAARLGRGEFHLETKPPDDVTKRPVKRKRGGVACHRT